MDIELIIGIVGLAVSIVGIPLAFLLARKGRQRPHIRFCTDFDELLSPDEQVPRQLLEVSYAGRPVDRVSRTIVALWSASGDTVRGADIVQGDPLRVSFPEGDVVLQVKPLACSRVPCGFALSIGSEGRDVAIDFDFLDPGDGIVVEVLHAGSSAGAMKGTLRGAVVRDRGRAALSSAHLDLVQMSRLGRARVIQSQQKRPDRRLLTRPTTPFLIGLVGMAGVAVWGVYRRQKAKLVDASKYDLSTLKGQGEFADRVQNEGTTGTLLGSLLPMGIALLAVVLIFVGVYFLLSRALIPRAITAIRPGPELDRAVRVRGLLTDNDQV